MILNANKKVIALFDFDGTITSKDSLGAFLLFNFGVARCFLAGIIYTPVHLFYKLGLLSSTVAKNFLFRLFFKGLSLQGFTKMCDDFTNDALPGIIREKAIVRIKWHLQNDHEVVIVSASPINWIKPWAHNIGIRKFITSQLEISGNNLTGNLDGKNCNHEEKVVRIRKEFPDIDSYEIYAYGNSKSDRFMLSLAQFKYYREFE